MDIVGLARPVVVAEKGELINGCMLMLGIGGSAKGSPPAAATAAAAAAICS